MSQHTPFLQQFEAKMKRYNLVIINATVWQLGDLGELSRIIVPDSTLLIRASLHKGLDIVDAAKELAYKTTVLACVTRAGKCLIHIQVCLGLQWSITVKNC